MTLKRLASGLIRGTTGGGGWATNTSENYSLYTVPAGKITYIKEIIFVRWGSDVANISGQIYLLKSGGIDAETTNSTDLRNLGTSNIIDAVPFHNQFSMSTGQNVQVLGQNTILEAGDKIKFRLSNNTGGNRNSDEYGFILDISGDESNA